jgi:hypothetical protein
MKEKYVRLLDIARAAEIEVDEKKSKLLEMILGCFPKIYRQIALSFDDEKNEAKESMERIQIQGIWFKLEELTVKIIQKYLKEVLNKITDLDVRKKTGIDEFNNENFINFRLHCQNTKLRSIYYRLVNNDFFSTERMQRFKMTSDNKCQRCNNVETTKHLLWECTLIEIVLEKGITDKTILNYSDLFNVNDIVISLTVNFGLLRRYF